ncbi:hypothetical protein [Tepidimonas taiwanensis]|uniref:hypothetical protein n=1 Tax=Tepidimonas taiwanensis TaxID=307486 RepID=UPI0005B985C0|nr:hypothetical protein [Tepidimonas taiwanensis]
MAKVAKKVQAVRDVPAAAAEGKVVQPVGYIEPHGGGERVEAVAPALVRQAVRAWGLVKRIDELEEELKGLKDELAQALGTGVSLVVPGVCRVSVAATSSVSVADADKLRELLGERFADLVTESVSYKPTEQLIEMSADGDDPMAPAYRALLKVRQGRAVRITAEK